MSKFIQITTGPEGNDENVDHSLYALDDEGRVHVYRCTIFKKIDGRFVRGEGGDYIIDKSAYWEKLL